MQNAFCSNFCKVKIFQFSFSKTPKINILSFPKLSQELQVYLKTSILGASHPSWIASIFIHLRQKFEKWICTYNCHHVSFSWNWLLQIELWHMIYWNTVRRQNWPKLEGSRWKIDWVITKKNAFLALKIYFWIVAPRVVQMTWGFHQWL